MDQDSFENMYNDILTTGFVNDQMHSNMSTDEIANLVQDAGYDPSTLTSDTLEEMHDSMNAIESDYSAASSPFSND